MRVEEEEGEMKVKRCKGELYRGKRGQVEDAEMK